MWRNDYTTSTYEAHSYFITDKYRTSLPARTGLLVIYTPVKIMKNVLHLQSFELNIYQQIDFKYISFGKTRFLARLDVQYFWQPCKCKQSPRFRIPICQQNHAEKKKSHQSPFIWHEKIDRMGTITNNVYFVVSFNRLSCQITEKRATQFWAFFQILRNIKFFSKKSVDYDSV